MQLLFFTCSGQQAGSHQGVPLVMFLSLIRLGVPFETSHFVTLELPIPNIRMLSVAQTCTLCTCVVPLWKINLIDYWVLTSSKLLGCTPREHDVT